MNRNDTSLSRDWPDSVEAAVSVLLSRLSGEGKAKVKSTAEADLIKFHHGWGTGIRNDFGLWADNRPLIESCIELGGPECEDADSASGVIIKAVWNRLNDLPLNHHQTTVFDSYPCETCGGEARVPRWQENEPAPPASPRCDECSWKSSPEYIQRQEPIRRRNEAAAIAFERARHLGVLIHEQYQIAKGKRSRVAGYVASSDDDLLLKVVRHFYTINPDFHTLWDEVMGEAPADSHLTWLRLWKRL